MAEPADANMLWLLQVGDGASPEQFSDFCAAFDISGLGGTNSLIDITTFCSGRNREYKGGLKEGNEVTIQANYTQDNTQLDGLMNDVDNAVTRNFKFLAIEESPPAEFAFSLAMLGWTVNAPIGDRGSVTLTGKLSGEIVRS